jgi:hypothetical protein
MPCSCPATLCISAPATTPDDESMKNDEIASPIHEKNDDERINIVMSKPD